ncbi:MAG: GxxExxY protein [Thermoplasmatota archaeon]
MQDQPVTTGNTGNPGDDPRTHAIIGAALEVHHTLGCGFLERVYQLALACEFRRRGIPFEAERPLPIEYKGERLPCEYRLDFLCFGDILLETKAILALGKPEIAQVLNYLKAGGLDVGLLINFGGTELEIRRLGSRPSCNAPVGSSPERNEFPVVPVVTG